NAEGRQAADRDETEPAQETESVQAAEPAQETESVQAAEPAQDAAVDAGASLASGEQPERQGESETGRPASSPFWFAVPEERAVVDESGQQLFRVVPGIWFLALEDHGSS